MDMQGIPPFAQSLLNMTESDDNEIPMCPKCKGTEKLEYSGLRTVTGCHNCTLKNNSEVFKRNPEKHLKDIGVPLRYTTCSFDNFQYVDDSVKNVLDKCKKIDRDFNSSLFLHSTRPGTGKTHIAVSIIRKLCENGLDYKPKFISSPFLFLEIKSSFNSENEEKENKIIEKYTHCDFLFVDDIGVEKCSDWANQIWYMIIDSRYSQMKPTFYTSNLSIGEIASKIDPRIASRLASGLVCNLDVADYRLKK
jgi:DNA replication protein DnaC